VCSGTRGVLSGDRVSRSSRGGDGAGVGARRAKPPLGLEDALEGHAGGARGEGELIVERVEAAVLAEQDADDALAHGDRDEQDLSGGQAPRIETRKLRLASSCIGPRYGRRVPTTSCRVDGRSRRSLPNGITAGLGVIANQPETRRPPG